MYELQRLTPAHAPALLAFETANRAWFARIIADRGDDYFTHFPERHAAILAEQAAGLHHFHVVTRPAAAIVGRVNLVDVAGGRAELGYRIAESASGAGLATAMVAQVCALAAGEYGLTGLTAVTTLDNGASAAVLRRNGFTVDGPITLGDRPGMRYVRDLLISVS
ncbi:GNAT family N-acetyltransferase [Catellatospora citrea]|uniref:N-acetyltransferase n=1 Tax=Catellatospora citrea TaxID=53366 RepID=A0A8J3KDG9_9ACTN|nr:GNAT family N-acetyltransferase [Catellatospora citrea]RKE10838.1 ribosomal-protein-alanine N-acetyltransferase [Catellatospora citrea]GIG00923.1 N-acetyltransferase [Catellatospora citrea]